MKRIIIMIILLLLLVVDIPIKTFYYDYLCNSESGTVIYEKAVVKGFIKKKPSRLDIPVISNSEECSPTCKRELRSLFIHNDAREAIFDNNIFLNVFWNDDVGSRKYAKLWIDQNSSPYCLVNLSPDDFSNYCGKDCVRHDKCVAGKHVNRFITPYIIEKTGWWDINDSKLGNMKTFSAIRDIESQDYAAKTTTFSYTGGLLYNIYVNLGFNFGYTKYKTLSNSCSGVHWNDTKKIVIEKFFK